jgi:hypothetical protein
VVARAALLLSGALSLCAAGAPAARTPLGPGASAETPIRIDVPPSTVEVPAQRLAPRRLTAVTELSGVAAPDAQLSIAGRCGRFDCEGLTYADVTGRWRTRMRLTTPRGHRSVLLRVAYQPALPGSPTVLARIKLSASAPFAYSAPVNVVQPGEAGAGTTSGAPPILVVIGDSLAMGTAQPMAADLPDWSVRTDARVGRPLAEGMDILATTPVPTGLAATRAVLAFSLYTNDEPSDTGLLEAAVRNSVARLGPHGCAIWATISRRAVHGISYRAANERLLQLTADPLLAGRLRVVPWAEGVAQHHFWKARDHVHATAAGNLARAQLYAEAARACAS